VVNVGVTHDTAEFAVESIRRWWRWDGQKAYPAAQKLLICATVEAVTAAGGEPGRRTYNDWQTTSVFRSRFVIIPRNQQMEQD